MLLYRFVHVIAWSVVLILMSHLVDMILRYITKGRTYRYALAPGIALHEISHAVGCLITGARILEMKVFSREGGYVRHGRPKVPFIGKPVISLAPIFGGLLVIYLMTLLLGYSLHVDIEYTNPISFITSSFTFILNNIHIWHFWIFLYVLVSISATIAPSGTDLKNSALGLGLLILSIALLLQMTDDLLHPVYDALEGPLLNGIVMGIVLLTASVIVLLPLLLIKVVRGPHLG